MPNYVINEIVIPGVKLDDVRKHLFDRHGRFSFNVLLPLPLNYWRGNSFPDEDAFPGNPDDAAQDMWGTNADAYGQSTAEDSDEGLTIRFQSSWEHPRGWVCALFNTVECDMTASWLSESGAPSHIEAYIAEGKHGVPEWTDVILSTDSDEHRHLHKLLWGVEQFPLEDVGAK